LIVCGEVTELGVMQAERNDKPLELKGSIARESRWPKVNAAQLSKESARDIIT